MTERFSATNVAVGTVLMTIGAVLVFEVDTNKADGSINSLFERLAGHQGENLEWAQLTSGTAVFLIGYIVFPFLNGFSGKPRGPRGPGGGGPRAA